MIVRGLLRVLAVLLLVGTGRAEPPVVVVDRDDVEIRESCRVEIAAPFIADANGDGVIHIATEGITVDFDGAHLHGAPEGTDPDAYTGCGVRVTAGDVTVRGLRVSGFKVGIRATAAHGILVEDVDVSGNFRQRLGSTPEAEDASDWLWPHANDDDEWRTRYGAGLCIEDTSRPTVRRVRARAGQNGIILDRVDDGRIYDNDCSFLSGWGLAMWRSSRNLVSRNAFDFCVRGYSHGVYNRGQDSAGILVFEQCSENVFVMNSATHGGDGLFAFAGQHALGAVEPRDDLAWYEGRGNNRNTIFGNDFSDAVAHGIELTFSFDNQVTANRLVGNGICGVWGGYSQRTVILGNTIEDNGEMAYGLERGGINIEHGHANRIEHNRFARNACGVHLWWDADEHLLALPWARANERGSSDNVIMYNRFRGDEVALHLRETRGTQIKALEMVDVGVRLDADDVSAVTWEASDVPLPEIALQPPRMAGRTKPTGARAELRGREHIIMTEWGPYDWASPLLHRVEATGDRHVYRLLGAEVGEVAVQPGGSVRVERGEDGEIVVRSAESGQAVDYRLVVTTDGRTLEARGLVLPLRWRVRAFAWRTDPREDADAWRAEAAGAPATVVDGPLRLAYGGGGPAEVDLGDEIAAAVPQRDRFGTLAEATVTLPPGRYRLRTQSDDGIRVWVDGEMVIDDWTWHATREHGHELEIDEARAMTIRVEHFELDGAAMLTAELDRAR